MGVNGRETGMQRLAEDPKWQKNLESNIHQQTRDTNPDARIGVVALLSKVVVSGCLHYTWRGWLAGYRHDGWGSGRYLPRNRAEERRIGMWRVACGVWRRDSGACPEFASRLRHLFDVRVHRAWPLPWSTGAQTCANESCSQRAQAEERSARWGRSNDALDASHASRG